MMKFSFSSNAVAALLGVDYRGKSGSKQII